MLDGLKKCLTESDGFCRRRGRPFIALSYAQSLDGSIASRDRRQVQLSGATSMRLTHELRACFDAIMVGIGTVLSDNPKLTTRLVDGSNPQPVILDTRLRTPTNACLVQRKEAACWIVSGPESDGIKRDRLVSAGAAVLPCKTAPDGKIDLSALMDLLVARKVNNIMVEGGARVITSFLGARLVDQLIVTITPKLIGGLNAIDDRGPGISPFLRLGRVTYCQLGDDIIMWARPDWSPQ